MTTRDNTAFLTHLLANTVQSLRLEGDALVQHRRALCLECPECEVRPGGTLRCRLCGCSDPTHRRPRCPAFKW